MANQIVVSAGAKVRNLNGVLTGTSGVVSSVPLGAANGVATLDSGGKVPVSQLPSSVVTYLGIWNAATNTPTLVNGTGDAGDMYICNVAGTVNFGAGPVTFAVGDWVLYGSGTWQKSSGQNGTVTSVAITESGDSLNITGSPITTSGTINIGFNGTNLQYVNGAGNLTTFPTLITSIGLSMPSAFSVANSPLTANGTIAVTGAGVASQYIRGDGTLADFPSSGGGGSSVSYYLNGGTSQGTIGGTTYYEMSKTAVIGTGVDFTKTGDGFIVAFLTDANDPAQLNIPAGNWNYEIYASMSANGGTPQMYAELYVYDGTTFTLISTSSNEIIYDGTALNLYTFAMAVPATSLTLTDRLAVKIYATNSGGKTTTIHTQDGHLCQIITTFSTGITALNGLTAQVQYFQVGTSGTDFNISSTTATHTFNLPTASAANRGALSSADWSIFNGKQPQLNGTGFVKASGTTITYDNSTYYLASNPSAFIALTALSAGTGISYNNTTGVITNSAPDQTVSLTAGAGISVSGSYPSFTIASTITQYTDALARAAISLTTTGTSGAATYNNTTGVLNIPQYTDQFVGTVTSVGLSSATSGVTIGSSPITTSGTITLAIATATTSQNGLLSSTDWTTFNNKQSALTNPVTGTGTTNYLPKFTGTSTIGNSIVQDDGTNATVGGGLTSSSFLRVNKNGSDSLGAGAFFALYNTAFTSAIFQQLNASNGLDWWNTSSKLMTLTTSGNLGLGVTPSAWSQITAIELSNGVSFGAYNAAAAPNMYITSNAYYNGTNWIYKLSSYAPTLYVQNSLGNYVWHTASTGTAGAAITLTAAMTFFNTGNLVIGTTTDSGYKLDVNGSFRATSGLISGTGDVPLSINSTINSPYLSFQKNSVDKWFLVLERNTPVWGMAANDFGIYNANTTSINFKLSNSTGAATFSSSVTATSFFESSDSRLKTLIQDNYQTKGIASITPKLYTKNGKVELGYYAQDFVGILDSAVSKGSDDMLSLSYREVLVAKVYALEQEIKELKAKMN